MDKSIPCPSCQGRKSSPCFDDGYRDGTHFGAALELPCLTCQATGTITAEHAERLSEGRRRAEDRKQRGLSLRDEAKRLGISPQELSDIEHGRQSDEWPS
jgi:hypothetical protein